MIKRLQRKFILIAAGSLLVVELLIIGLINIINYAQINNREDQLLNIMLDNGGDFPEFFKRRDMGREDFEQFNNNGSDPPPKPEDSSYTDPKGEYSTNSVFKSHMNINEETRYQTRYFYIKYNKNLEPDKINTGHIAAISSEEAVTYAEKADATCNAKGYIDDYKFAMRETSDGGRLFVFMDCREDNSTKQRFLLMSAGISLGGYVLVCLLIIILSKFAVKPFIENYEKQRMFITDAGHEIKTPLAIISANTEVIEMIGEPSEWTQSIKNQIERLNGLIANLLKLARMEEGGTKPEFAVFDLSDAFIDIAEPFKTLAANKGLSLDISCEEGIMLNGDEGSIRQVVSIFTENAVKYCDEGGSISARLYKTGSGKHAVIEVENDCKNPPAEPDRLFDRFYRADESRVRENGEAKSGYGIGLSVAKAAIESHKGKIFCKTDKGRITFTARLKI